MIILIGVFCIAVYMDLRFYRIPNLCILAGMTGGLIMTYVSYSADRMLASCVEVVILFIGFYPFYLIKGLGAGDVKLLMMTGCFFKGERLIQYLLVTFAVAAVIAFGKMLFFAESRQRLFYLAGYLKKAALTGNMDEYKMDKTKKKCVIRMSVPAFASLLMMYVGIY